MVIVEQLQRLRTVAEALGESELSQELRLLEERLSAGSLFVACLGQFKRGKSTLINALLGQPLLPVGVVPVTSVVTVVREGPRVRATARFASGTTEEVPPAELDLYVSEQRNPGNKLQVVAIELQVPSPLLRDGLCLIDTPGVGSIFAANTATTRQFVPHIDAAIVVLGADPPLSGEELALLREIARQTDALYVVMNKADRVSAADLAEARIFVETTIGAELRGRRVPVFEVSAAERLAGSGEPREWPALLEALDALRHHELPALLRAAQARAKRVFSERLLSILDERRAVLERPLQESESKLARLEAAASAAEESAAELGLLLEADEATVTRAAFAEHETFLVEARVKLAHEVEAAMAKVRGEGRRGRGPAEDAAHRIAFELLEHWLRHERPRIELLYAKTVQRFTDRANAFLKNIATSGVVLPELPPALEADVTLRETGELYYTHLMRLTGPSLGTWLLDLLGSTASVERRIARDSLAYADRLLVANGSRVIYDMRDRLSQSRAAQQARLGRHLRAASQDARRALEHARRVLNRGTEAVTDEVQRLTLLQEIVVRASTE